MSVRVELKIVYDGSEPGLSESRLSLSSFADTLRRLVVAFQRTGSGMLSQALDDPEHGSEYGAKGGKVVREAALLDLELVSLDRGSTAPVFVAVARPNRAITQLSLINDLPGRVVKRFVDDIEAESKGIWQNWAVRKYLSSVPDGVTKQGYSAVVDGKVVAQTEFATAAIAQPTVLPRLYRTRGSVVAVGFEPGTTFVTLRDGAKTLRCSADPHLVDQALACRDEEVLAAVLESKENRLIWIRKAGDAYVPPALDQTITYLDARWGDVLRALAR